jgi:hypothetical protein
MRCAAGVAQYRSPNSDQPAAPVARGLRRPNEIGDGALALAIACGIRLGGVRTALLVQNAGVFSMGAGMVSLAQRYQFPPLLISP